MASQAAKDGSRGDLVRRRSSDRAGQRLIAVVLVLFIYAFWCDRYCQFTTDDAYISYRYAENLAHGNGLVYDVGERVEGFSNPLWTLTLAATARAGFDVLTASKILGALAGAVTILLGLAIASRIHPFAGFNSLVVLGPLVAMPSLYLYAVGGLETVPYACLVAAVVYLAMRAKWGAALPLAGAAAWMRPEGFILALLFAILGAWHAISKPALRRAVCVGGLFDAVVVAALFAARLSYYGRWLPNTYYAKPYGVMAALPATTMSEIAGFVAASGGPICVLLWVAGVAQRQLRCRLMPALVAVVVEVALAVRSGGDWMPGFRFLVPALIPFTAAALALLVRYLRRAGVCPRLGPPILALTFVCVGLGQTYYQFGQLGYGRWPEGLMNGRTQVEAGRWFGEHYGPSTTIAIKRIGAVGYHSHLPIVDTLGLVDRDIASIWRVPVDRKQRAELVADEVIRRHPDLIVLCSEVTLDVNVESYPAQVLRGTLGPSDGDLMDRALAAGYRYVTSLSQGRMGQLWILQRASH